MQSLLLPLWITKHTTRAFFSVSEAECDEQLIQLRKSLLFEPPCTKPTKNYMNKIRPRSRPNSVLPLPLNFTRSPKLQASPLPTPSP